MGIEPMRWKISIPTSTTFLLLLYILSILFFAILYFLSNESFYSSTTKYDRNFKDEVINTISHLTEKILEPLKKDDAEFVYNGWILDKNKISYETSDLSGSNFTYLFDFPFVKKDKILFVQVQASFSFLTRLLEYHPDRPENSRNLSKIRINFLDFDLMKQHAISSEFLKPIFEKIENYSRIQNDYLALPIEDWSKLLKLKLSYDGSMRYSFRTFLNFLYLSTSIQTASASGDIMPVNTYARFLMGIQAFLSLILIGLLINSIILKQAKRVRTHNKSSDIDLCISNITS